jgi:CxxC motif-containing protein (DUF1111 family)
LNAPTAHDVAGRSNSGEARTLEGSTGNVKQNTARSKRIGRPSPLAAEETGGYGAAMALPDARVALVMLLACTAATVACATSGDDAGGAPGTPLPGLRPQEVASFDGGRALFEKVFAAEDGLGPLFNENQCSACHTVPASGGTSGFERVVKATRFGGPGACDLLTQDGGQNVRTQATPQLKAHGIERQPVPTGATEIGRFTPPSLFGLGLIAEIPEAAILAHADPDDTDRDAISGRVGRALDGRLARFGRKAEFATIAEFVESALQLEMGLTTPRAPEELVPRTITVRQDVDLGDDPEIDQASVDLLTAFVRFLNAPAPATPRSPAHNDSIAAGRRVFTELRCSACHIPSMRTGRSEIDALDRKTISLYSDLLLHDMGPGLTNVCTPSAAPTELRTEMLMGVRHRDRLLHDGRTSDLREAILAHGGEAQRARDAFARLSWSRQEYVLKFLRSL